MKLFPSIIGGLAGSAALAILQRCLVNKTEDALRMDDLGTDALSESFDAWDIPAPRDEDEQYETTLAADIAGNAAYYALVGLSPKHSCLTGSLLGVTAGTSALLLPEHKEYSSETPKTKALTLLLYITGGLVAGTVYKLLAKN